MALKLLNSPNRVTRIALSGIKPNPSQPRGRFPEAELKSLADSIAMYGVLSPLTVRRVQGGGYELIAGERRLRAAKLAGLSEVPCIVVEADDKRSSLIALVENLQRADLDFFEEAAGLKRLISVYGMTQEEAAERIGRSQSSVANKLRLLRLTDDERAAILSAGLTERHARALIRIADEPQRRKALAEIVRRGLNVGETDAYIDALLAPRAAKKRPVSFAGLRDVRFFVNTVNRAVGVMRRAGVMADMMREESEKGLRLTIFIPSGK